MFSFGKLSKKKFAAQLIAAIARANSGAKFHYDAKAFSLVGEDDEEQTINLSNLYAEHCSLEEEDRGPNLDRIASIFAGSAPEIEEDFESAKPHLRPKIWNRSTFEFMELKRRIEGGKPLDLPLYPVGNHLYSTLVYDTENAMRSLSNEELEAWGVSYYEAFEIACQNLEESTVAFANIGDSFYSAATGDSYDSSRVMLLDRIRSFQIDGDCIAVVPQRDAMHVAGSTDEVSLSILFDFTEQNMNEDARPLCPLPMRLEDGEWVDWRPPMNHVLRKRFDELELRYLGGLYNEQKELLDELHSIDVVDAPFVASFSAMQKEEQTPVSYCVWAKDVDTFLPRTQMVMFCTESGVAAAGEWDHVVSIVGDMMVVDEEAYPARYRVRAFPTKQQLDEIGTLEI